MKKNDTIYHVKAFEISDLNSGLCDYVTKSFHLSSQYCEWFCALCNGMETGIKKQTNKQALPASPQKNPKTCYRGFSPVLPLGSSN